MASERDNFNEAAFGRESEAAREAYEREFAESESASALGGEQFMETNTEFRNLRFDDVRGDMESELQSAKSLLQVASKNGDFMDIITQNLSNGTTNGGIEGKLVDVLNKYRQSTHQDFCQCTRPSWLIGSKIQR